MSKKTKFYLIISFIISILFVQESKSQNINIEVDSANFYFQKKNFSQAAIWYQKAKISSSQPKLDTSKYADVMRQLAICYVFTKDTANAKSSFKEAINNYSLLPNKKNQLASTLMNFGIFYFNQKKYQEALPIFSRAINIKKELSGENNADFLNILSSLAQCQLNLKMYVEAEENLKKLVSQRGLLLGGNHPDYINSSISLADLYKTLYKNDKSLEIYLEVSEALKSIKGENSKEYANICIKIGNAYEYQLDYNKAEIYFTKANAAYLTLFGEKNQDYAYSLVKLATINRLQGKYNAAEPLYFKAQNIYKEISGEISADFATILNNIALFYAETGKYTLAENTYKYAIEISRQVLGERNPETATTYSNLGLLYKNMGRYDQAEPILKKSLKYRKEILGENTPEYAASLNNLAGLYENMGRLAEAEPLYSQSLLIIKNTIGERNGEYASTLNNLAGVYEAQKKYNKAEPLYLQSLSIMKELYGENHPDYSTTLNNLAILLESIGKREESEKIYKQNIETLKAMLGPKHPNYATALNNYAILLESIGRYIEAEKYFIMALDIRNESLGDKHPEYTTTLYDLAKLYAAKKEYSNADLYWDRAINNYLYQIDIYFPAMSEKEKGKFYQTISPKFEQFNSYALLRYNQNPSILGKMYDYQLATKALLLNSTNKVKQRILASGDFLLIEKYKKWNSQKELLSKTATMSKEDQIKLNINLDELISSTNDLEKELNSSSEIFKTANDTKRYSWVEIQKNIKPDEAAIELIRFTKYRFDSSGIYTQDSIYYAALIVSASSKTNPELIIIKNGVELEKQYLKYYRNSIKNKVPDEFGYSQYWSRIKKGLNPNVKKIFLSPDGVYNMVNLNTLQNTQTKNFLFDEIEIRIITNTKNLLSASTAPNIEKKVTLVGNPDFAYNAKNISSTAKGLSADQASFIERASSGILAPLPGTKVEIEQIAGMLGTNNWYTTVYTEGNANEETIKKVDNPKILHIATHGFFEQDGTSKNKNDKKESPKVEENPLLKSGLMLSGASLTLLKRKNDVTNTELTNNGNEDGILTAYEAMNLNLEKTDLVVLSACETGLGEIKNGEGVYGLQRALNVAGAKTLIFSLWTVNDAATQKLMTTFYQEMLKPNSTKRQSFKNAQNALRKDFPEPYYWGAFVMVGD